MILLSAVYIFLGILSFRAAFHKTTPLEHWTRLRKSNPRNYNEVFFFFLAIVLFYAGIKVLFII